MRLKFAALLLASVSLGAAQSAVAADLPARGPVYKAPPAPIAFSWTGCYVGGNVGGLWTNNDWNDAGGADAGSHTASGVTAGGQLGCNYQTGPWVLGVEGMFNWADANGDHTSLAGIGLHTDTNWLANVTGRVGYAFDRSLLYVKGGGAWIDQSHTATVGAVLFDAGDSTRGGWTVGAGWEYAFAPNWSAKIEYNYMDFGSQSPTFTSPAGVSTSFNIDQNAHLALFGINYRFGGNPLGPVAPWR
jgi:outer membrane immunogenic protein